MKFPQDVGHAGFVAQEGSEVDRLAGVVFGPRLHLPAVTMAPLVAEEAQVAMPGSRKFPMGLGREPEKTTVCSRFLQSSTAR